MTMTTSTVCDDFPTLTGRQKPHNESVFEGSHEHGEKALTLAARAKTKAMPWQRDAMHAILSTTPEGRWTHRSCCLIVPRQNGKSMILILRALYGLFVLGETIVFTAQRWVTAEKAYERLVEIISSRTSLNRRVVKATCSQGRGRVLLKSGAEIVFTTRSADTARGFDKIDLVIYDEAYNLTEGHVGAIGFTQLASDNAQTIYASSAVNADQHPNGQMLASIRKSGLDKEPGLYFAEYMAPEEMPRAELATLEYANPSFGVIQTEADLQDLLRPLKTPAGRKTFDVEALGRGDWPALGDEVTSWAIIPEERWKAMVDRVPDLTGQIAISVDLSADRKWWAIAAAQRTVEGRIHIEVGYFSAATHAEVVKYLVDTVTVFNPCALVIDGRSNAKVIIPLLIDAKIEPTVTTTQQMVVACGGFFDDATTNDLLSHTNQPILTDSVEGATQRVLPQGDWAWDTQGGTVISPLVGATLARWALVEFGSTPLPGPSSGPAFEEELVADEFDALSAAF